MCRLAFDVVTHLDLSHQEWSSVGVCVEHQCWPSACLSFLSWFLGHLKASVAIFNTFVVVVNTFLCGCFCGMLCCISWLDMYTRPYLLDGWICLCTRVHLCRVVGHSYWSTCHHLHRTAWHNNVQMFSFILINIIYTVFCLRRVSSGPVRANLPCVCADSSG